MSILWRLIGLMRPIRRHTVMPKDLQGLIARSGNQMDAQRGRDHALEPSPQCLAVNTYIVNIHIRIPVIAT